MRRPLLYRNDILLDAMILICHNEMSARVHHAAIFTFLCAEFHAEIKKLKIDKLTKIKSNIELVIICLNENTFIHIYN